MRKVAVDKAQSSLEPVLPTIMPHLELRFHISLFRTRFPDRIHNLECLPIRRTDFL
jgi:hypothetical protein